jgi:hypothetical protein
MLMDSKTKTSRGDLATLRGVVRSPLFVFVSKSGRIHDEYLSMLLRILITSDVISAVSLCSMYILCAGCVYALDSVQSV